VKTIIQAGYRVTVTTWENDGDNYNTKTVEGLTESEAEFIVKLCKIHYSKNAYKTVKGFGNMYDPNDTEIEKYHAALQKMLDEHTGDTPEYCDDPEGMQEYGYKLGLTGGEFYTRVCENIKVEFIPEQIEIDDVTAKFV
jgi:hypothetical protein